MEVAVTAEALGVTSRAIEHLKKRFVEKGFEAALERKRREKPPREVTFDGAFEARLIALACSDTPEGHLRWTVRLLADKVVELNIASSVSHMTVQRILKKTNLNLTDDQKRTEEELQKSRAVLQATIDNLPFDFFAIGMDGRYILQNATSKAHWGDVVGKRPEDAAESEEDLILWKENNRRALAGEKVEEDVTVTIKGAKRCYHNVIAPIIDAGQTQGILGMNVDITERKRAEAALRESEQRFRSLFQDSPVGAAAVTPNGKFLQVNRAFCDFLGYTESELVSQTVLSVTHPEDRDASSTAIRQAAESGPRIQRLEKRYLHKSGQVLWGEVSSTPVCDAEGKPSYLIAQVLDIGERKQAEEALRKSERTLRTLIDVSPEAIGLVDTEETVLIINETAARRLGTTTGKITGQKLYSFVPPRSPPIEGSVWRRLFARASQFASRTTIWRTIENAMHPVLDEQERVAAVAILAIDRTEHKRAEAALKQAHDELERRVEERTAELTTANAELQAVYDGMFEGLLILDFETKRLIRVNSSLCQMLGYTEERVAFDVSDGYSSQRGDS